MIKTISSSLCLTLSAFAICALAPPIASLLITPFLVAVAAYFIEGAGQIAARPLSVAYLTATIVLLLLTVLGLFREISSPSVTVAALVGAAYAIGYELKQGRVQVSWGYWRLFFLAFLLFVGTLAFAAVDRYELGMYAKILFYPAFGALFAYKGISWARTQLLLLPFVSIFAAGILDPGENSLMWIIFWLQPIVAGVFLNLGYALVKFEGLKKAIPAVSMIALSATYALGIPKLMFHNTAIPMREPIGSFLLVDLEGDTLRQDDIDGKVVWMSFYSTHCRPCLTEMAHLSVISETFKGNPKVDFIAVCSEQFDTYENFKDSKVFQSYGIKVGYEHEANLAKRFSPVFVPNGVLINTEGTVVLRKEGFLPTDERYFDAWLTEEIQALL